MKKSVCERICTELEQLKGPCREIYLNLKKHLENAPNEQYFSDIQKDIVTVNNVITIINTVQSCLQKRHVCEPAEVLARMAAYIYGDKLLAIPYRKTMQRAIVSSLREIHEEIFNDIRDGSSAKNQRWSLAWIIEKISLSWHNLFSS